MEFTFEVAVMTPSPDELLRMASELKATAEGDPLLAGYAEMVGELRPTGPSYTPTVSFVYQVGSSG